MKHFSHFHTLTFIEECEFEGTTCHGCLREISGPLYACNRCQLFLHKFCAEAPTNMTHHFHPQHQLSLAPRRSCICDICHEHWQGFTYRCSTCDFDVDIKCASAVLKIQQPIQHTCHEHKLITLEKSINLLCDACNTKHEGISYLCNECGFWVNQDCADSFPTTIELTSPNCHPHPLTLIYSIPHKGEPNCEICWETVTRNQWAYFCSQCDHFFHVNCLKSEIQHSRDQKAKTTAKKFDPSLLKLPRADESVDLIVQLIKNLVLEGKKKTNGEGDQQQPNINHDHELIINSNNLKTDRHSEASCSSAAAAAAAVSKQSEIRPCNGCGETILEGSSYLQCAKPECNFFIHNCCAELPNELEHPCHLQHPILLITHQPPIFFPCRCCGLFCSTFFYGCVDCSFYIDVKCASLPIGIRHASHQHTLALRESLVCCSLCGSDLGYFKFVCETCSHNVCIQCALLLGSIRHRYDKHPFTLTYPSSSAKDKDHAGDDEDHYEEDYCEICEEDTDSEMCFYHCHECDQSLHIKCFYPSFNDIFSNIKYGINFRARFHPHHPLTTVRSPKDGNNSVCILCKRFIGYQTFPLAFECADCNFWVHYICGWILFPKLSERPTGCQQS